jgi:hypothetical protein
MMPEVPLFLLTVHYGRELELAALQSGVRAVFSKYDDLERLIKRARVELKLKSDDDTEFEQQRRGSSERPD